MPAETQNRILHYRCARLTKKSVKLQGLLHTAVKQFTSPQDRLEAVDKGSAARRLLNQAYTYNGMLCGNLVLFTAGANQLLIKAKEQTGGEAGFFPLEELAPPGDSNSKSEWLESILYFCVFENHVLLLQSRSLRASAFEEYVDWIIKKAKLLAPEDVLTLADQASNKVASMIKKSHVKTVSIGMPFVSAAAEEVTKKASLKLGGPMLSAIRGILGKEVDHMRLEDALDGNIQATLNLRWERKTTASAQRVLDEVATALRDVEPELVEIVLNNGNKIHGSELKLTATVGVRVKDHIVEQASLYKAMREKMRELIDAGALA